jgi:hypothetical protein
MSWSSYPSTFALGHRAMSELLLDPVTVEEKIDGCVTLDTPIMCADLMYRSAGDLRVGDRLIGFDDRLADPRLQASIVTAASPIMKPCYEIITTSRKVIASSDHPWLIAKPDSHSENTHSRKRWRTSEALRSGDKIIALPVWSFNESWSSGYLSGFFNGEGSLVRHKNQRILSAYQTVGPVLDDLQERMRALGFTLSVDTRQRNSRWKRSGTVVVRGGWPEILRFLGTTRPSRLLAKAPSIWIGAPMNYIQREEVVSVREAGEQEVMGLSTSTGTYIANGLLCHNSQFSFGIFEEPGLRGGDMPGELVLRCRSKGAQLNLIAPEKMFTKAIETVQAIEKELIPGWTYRAEYLAKPKHNVLAYDRTPKDHLIIFDINTGLEEYLPWYNKAAEANRLGLEVVPLLFEGMLTDVAMVREMLERVSILGGQKIEGVVIKNYSRYGPDKKALIGKYVSEAFKEVHAAEWKQANPNQGDIVQMLIAEYRTPARWAKAVQHLTELGALESSPKDIGLLMKEIPEDIATECEEEIKQKIWSWVWPKVRRGVTAGVAEWYKERLLEKQFQA